MTFDATSFFLEKIARAWERNAGHTRVLISFATAFCAAGIALAAYANAENVSMTVRYLGFGLAILGAFVLLVIAVLEQVRYAEKVESELEQVQTKARENPDKPEYAWDLARSKLERYLDRNLYEVRAIFFLTTTVMVAGFVLVLYGLIKAFADPASLPVSIVSAVSGVLLSFIGGSFLLIYRSVLAQSATYVAILERINAVGMAVQIAATVPDTDAKLKSETTAALAKTLLTMYGTSKSSTPGTDGR